jgi:hypothetical protein
MAKQNPASEVDAMKAVDQALEGLNEDARNRVLDWARSKFGVQTSRSGVTNTGPEDPARQLPAAAPTNIKSFFAQKKPESFYERVACLAYYLEKHGGMTELKTRDISKANTDARLSKMSNPALFVKHATDTYGFLSRLAHGKIGISGRGEALVEALPDRAKVKQALEENPLRKKAAKTKRKPS